MQAAGSLPRDRDRIRWVMEAKACWENWERTFVPKLNILQKLLTENK